MIEKNCEACGKDFHVPDSKSWIKLCQKCWKKTTFKKQSVASIQATKNKGYMKTPGGNGSK